VYSRFSDNADWDPGFFLYKMYEMYKHKKTARLHLLSLGLIVAHAKGKEGREGKQAEGMTEVTPETPTFTVYPAVHVVLLGQGGAGKTSLARRLVTGLPCGDVEVTHGVHQRRYSVSECP
jgi:ABC-type glutathione transport system ATPase component